MNYTEKYCTDLLQKVIDDLSARMENRLYYDKEAPFEAIYKENEENFFTKKIVKHSWLVYAKVPKDGWKGGNIIIHIDDDTGKVLTYMNTALGGRPITIPLEIDEDGNYMYGLEFF